MTDRPLFLALDQGGHSSRAMVFDEHANIVAKAQTAIHTHRYTDSGGGERIEHSAPELAQSLLTCCDEIADALGDQVRRLSRAGLATQRSSIVAWRRSTGEAMTPVISWQDRRAEQQVETLATHADRIADLTGLVLSPHYGASKLHWCLNHDKNVQEAKRQDDLTLGPLASYLARALTGHDDLCDPANASRTLLWDRHQRDWSDELCALFGVPRHLLPRSVATRHSFGSLKLGASGETVPLSLMTGDQSAAIYAFGQPEPGSAFVNLGTGAFMQCPVGGEAAEVDGLLNSVVYRDEHRLEYVLEGTVNGAGSALTWWSTQCGVESKTLLREALARQDQDDDWVVPVFLNGISGLGSPFWVSDFESRFVTANNVTATDWLPDAHAGALAIMESIAFLLTANLNAANRAGVEISQLILTGGLASVDEMCQTLADVSGIKTARSRLREATATGTGCLLANSASWPDANQLTRFEQRENTPLLERYKHWQSAMKQALADSPPLA